MHDLDEMKCEEISTPDFFGRFSFVRYGISVLNAKWNERVLRAGSVQIVPAHGSELLSSQAPAPVGQSAGISRVVAGKCTRALWTFPFKLVRTNSFRPARTDKGTATLVMANRTKE